MPPASALKDHCWVCAKYAQCPCHDCRVPSSSPLPSSLTAGFAQVVGGGVIKIPAQPVKEAT